MMESARAQLQSTFRAKQEEGLCDMKFFFGKVSESTVEDVSAVVNRILADVDAGKALTVPEWGDSNRSGVA